ncbi:MAG: cell wall-binding repeat-containing protein [Euzebyales bacterium]|nr:cell wall-binding repeat-containing protein [Euzebyales bacterium]
MQRIVVLALAGVVVVAVAAAPVAAQPDGGGSLSGTVSGRDGAALPGALVTVVLDEGDPACPDDTDCPETVTTTTAEDGTWTVGDLPEGAVFVHAADADGAAADAWWPDDGVPTEPVPVAADQETTGIDFELPAAATVTGQAVDAAGRPVSDAQVTVRRTFFSAMETATAADGRFTLSGLRGATHTVTVAAPSDDLLDGEFEVILEEGGTADVRVVLDPATVAVTRVSGANRLATAVAAAQHGWPDGSATVVIAAAGAFPDALAAAPLATAVGGPLLLVGPRTAAEVLAEVDRLGATEAVIVGAVGAVPLIVGSELDRAGVAVRRIAGDSRADTAALIAREVGAPAGEAIVTSGDVFADALSIAPLAAAEGVPILLTARDQLAPDTAEALRDLGVERTLVIGGTGAVTDQVAAGLPSPTRVAGRNRFETSVAVADLALDRDLEPRTVHLATGFDYPDALAAGPVAARARGALLLVDGSDPANAGVVYDWLAARRDDISGGVAFGGTAAISAATLERFADAIGAGQGPG